MKATVIDRLGAAPHPAACPDPSPATGDHVLVKVEAAALNAVDLHIAAGTIVTGSGPARARRGPRWPDARRQRRDGRVLLLTDRATCIPGPDGLDSVAAAAIGVVGTSADLSLRRAGIQAGESVLVLGATGPLGAAFLQLARLAGAKRVIAAGRNPERLAQVPAADGVAILSEGAAIRAARH